MTSPSTMSAGGGDPYMGLLGTINPQTSGLLQMPQQAQAMPAMMQSYQPQNFGVSPGTNWSQAAYQLAGSPNQNPFQNTTLSPASTPASSPAGGGATALGGTALGILGALGKAAGTNTPLGNAITGLMGGSGNSFGTYTTGNIANVGNVAGNSIASAGASAAAPYTTGLLSSAADAAGTAGIAPVGSGAIDAAADAGASAAIPGLEAGGEAAGGLLGGGAADLASFSPELESVGTGAIDAAADAGVAEGAAATGGADAAAGVGLGAGLGATAGLAGVLAPAIIGMSTPAVSLTPKYWDGVQSSLQSAIASGNRGQIAAQVTGLLNQPQSQIPQNIQQLVYSTGFVPSMGWGTSYVPNQSQLASNILQQSGKNTGGNGGNISVNRA